MATDDVNIAEDAEMAECDGDKVVTMMDVLQEQQDFEEDANAVLGASDDKNCTYPKGYIKRQALYACLTCCTEAKVDPTKRAGVCLACSLTCHENHELIELYTKRNFRCDCGNPKFNSNPCQFTSDKTELNDENIYNQNFSGLYCTCQRPYPDPDSTIEDDMIQCIVCEDWLHATHLETVVPANDQYSEMVCKSCMEKNDFLHDYSMFAVATEASDVDILTVNGDTKSAGSLCNGDLEKEKLVNGIEENQTTSVRVNGDLEMDEDKEKSENNGKDDIENIEDTETVPAETKQDESSSVETTELKPEENEKPNTDDSKMDLGSDTKITEQEEKSVESTETKEQKEKIEDTLEKSDEKSDAAENTPPADKMESSDTEPEKADETIKEQTETEEQNSKQSTNEETDNTDTPAEETTETATEDKPVENMQQSEDSKEKEEVKSNKEESPQETVDGNIDKTEEKPVENETSTGNIEVPDTSQTEKDAKENAEEKTDAVMDAIDELLQTTNEAKEKEPEEETKEPTSESTESSKETTDDVETKDSENVEMSASENKVEIEEPEKTEVTADSNDKPSASTEDVEMSDASTRKESESESKVDEASTNSKNTEEKSEEVTDSISQENITSNENDNRVKTTDENDSTNKTEPSKDEEVPSLTENTKENKRKLSTEFTDDISPKKVKLDCVRPKDVKRVHKGATFWPSNFRQKLCTCGECLSMYKDLKVLFLTDLEDTVFAYESLGKENVDGGASQYEKGMQALSSLGRIQQINALTEYNRMRDKLLDFLKSFKDRKEIVKEEDIKAFFAGMKPRREPDGVYFCR